MACPRLCIGKLCNVGLADYRFACFSCSVGIACYNDVQTGGQCAGIDCAVVVACYSHSVRGVCSHERDSIGGNVCHVLGAVGRSIDFDVTFGRSVTGELDISGV